MNFTFFSPLSFGLGLGTLAGALYLLQRLRVRHREVDVVTTLFWHEAVHDTRARVLTQRFRHPWAYLLILVISALLWMAMGDPRRTSSEGPEYVCLLDSSAGMARSDRFGVAKARLLEWSAELPRERRTVLSVGARRRALLVPGEELALLEGRLETLVPSAAPCAVERELELLARTAQAQMTVFVFGGEPLDEGFATDLAKSIEVHFVDVETSDATESQNRGITALGVSEAASGAWDAVDVFVEVSGPPSPGATGIAADVDGDSAGLEALRMSDDDNGERYLFRDVHAAGGIFSVGIDGGDDLALDDRAQIRLPSRLRLRVAVADSLLEILGPVLESDPAVVLVEETPDIAVVGAGDSIGSARVALRFVPATSQVESFLVTYSDDRPAEVVLREAIGFLGLDAIDSAGLAQTAQTPITMGVRPGERREIAVWEELIGEEYDFSASRSFPLFVARAVRWLTDAQGVTPWVAAGEELRDASTFGDADGTRLDPVGAPFVPPSAGTYVGMQGESLLAALLSPGSTIPTNSPATPVSELDTPAGESDLVSWLAALALLLLCWEWALVRTQRIP